MEPDEALCAAFDFHQLEINALQKKANAKLRKAKGRKAAPTSDMQMNGTTKKPTPKKPNIYAVAPWLEKNAPKSAVA